MYKGPEAGQCLMSFEQVREDLCGCGGVRGEESGRRGGDMQVVQSPVASMCPQVHLCAPAWQSAQLISPLTEEPHVCPVWQRMGGSEDGV